MHKSTNASLIRIMDISVYVNIVKAVLTCFIAPRVKFPQRCRFTHGNCFSFIVKVIGRQNLFAIVRVTNAVAIGCSSLLII